MATIKDAALWFECRASKTPMAGARAMFWLAADALNEEAEREAKPMTNADKIRAMSDEELADWLAMGAVTGSCIKLGIAPAKCIGMCKKCIMEWLKQSAKEG